jgi:hypothetical protein
MFRATNREFLAAAALLLLLAAAPFSQAQVKPALTRDISTATPVSGYCTASEFDTPGYARCFLYTVPAGKRLVVEMVSYNLAREPSLQVTQLLFGKAETFSSNFLFGPKVLQVTPQSVFNPTVRAYGGSQAVRLYLEENETLGAIAYFQTGGPAYEQQFGFVGYIVDK